MFAIIGIVNRLRRRHRRVPDGEGPYRGPGAAGGADHSRQERRSRHALLVANPIHILEGILGGLTGVLKGSKFDKKRYLEHALKMMLAVSEQGCVRRAC